MNRYVLGGATVFLLLVALWGGGGISQRLRGNAQVQNGTQPDNGTLGTLPIEQAGQVVRRQGGDPAPIDPLPMDPDNLTPENSRPPASGSFTTPGDIPPTIRPSSPPTNPPQNVIPRQGVTTLPAPVGGDIAPVQPDLVRPDPLPPVIDDPGLESIPALW